MLPQVTEDFDLFLQVADGVVHVGDDAWDRLGFDSRPGFALRTVRLPADNVLPWPAPSCNRPCRTASQEAAGGRGTPASR